MRNTLVFWRFTGGSLQKNIFGTKQLHKFISGWYLVYPAPTSISGCCSIRLESGYAKIWWPGEFLGLRVMDCSFAADGKSVVCNLGLTKMGKRKGVVEYVTLDDINVVGLIALCCQNKLPADKLYQSSNACFRQGFNACLLRLGLSGKLYKPYSMRRGGATHLFRTSGSYSIVEAKGRWSSAKTAKSYVDEAKAELAKLRPSLHTQKCIASGMKLYRAYFAWFKAICLSINMWLQGFFVSINCKFI